MSFLLFRLAASSAEAESALAMLPAAVGCKTNIMPDLQVRCHAEMVLVLWRRILDNLPVAISKVRDDGGQPVKMYERGFPVGAALVRIW